MRNYIFRAKRSLINKWVEGYLAGYDLICPEEPEDVIDALGTYYGDRAYAGFININPETISQFTGMHDIHGNRIFEGDIVTALMDYGPAGMNRTAICIEFDINAGGYEWQYFDLDTLEIIGNKYDNPELLE